MPYAPRPDSATEAADISLVSHSPGLLLTSILHDGPPVESADRFALWLMAGMLAARVSRRVGAGFHCSGRGPRFVGQANPLVSRGSAGG